MPKIPVSLFSPRRWIQTGTNVLRESSDNLGPKQWVICRSLCLFRVFVLGDIPAQERKNSLEIKILQWSPYKETGRYIVWNSDSARVWIWDEAQRSQLARDQGVTQVAVIPETVILPSQTEGIHLIVCKEGVEGQVWSNNMLVATHWWREKPSTSDWRWFLLSQDLNPDFECPIQQNLPFLKRPWAKSALGKLFFDARYERYLVSVISLILIFFLAYYSAGTFHWRSAAIELNQQSKKISKKIEPVLRSRTEALESADKAKKLADLFSSVSQLRLMATIAEILPAKKVILSEWDYHSGHLAIIITGKTPPDPLYYVNAFQKIPYIKNVSSEKGTTSNRLRVKMTVSAN